jgi:hypothetical protein
MARRIHYLGAKARELLRCLPGCEIIYREINRALNIAEEIWRGSSSFEKVEFDGHIPTHDLIPTGKRNAVDATMERR